MRKKTKIGLWSATTGLALVAVLGGTWAILAPTQPAPPEAVHATSAMALDTPERAAGWADDVFVGTVTQQLGVERTKPAMQPGAELDEPPDGVPYTVFRVEVRSVLKGRVTGAVRVAQLGSSRSESAGSEAAAPSLQSGGTYVLATRVSTKQAWHNVPLQLDVNPVDGTQDAQVDRWQQAVANAAAPAHAPISALHQDGVNIQQAYDRAAAR